MEETKRHASASSRSAYILVKMFSLCLLILLINSTKLSSSSAFDNTNSNFSSNTEIENSNNNSWLFLESFMPPACDLARWPMNEGSGTILTDFNGNLPDNTITGATWTTRPDGGNALSFNGAGDHINLGDDANLKISGDITIAMWINPDNFANRQNPWAKAYGGEGTITLEKSGSLNFYWGTGGGNASPYTSIGSGYNLPLSTWTHIAVVRDVTNGIAKWYVNGVETSSKLSAMSGSVSTLPAYIGRGYVSDFAGDLDEVQVFNCALSAAEIADLFDPTEICDNGIDDDGDNLIDCSDPDCDGYSSVSSESEKEITSISWSHTVLPGENFLIVPFSVYNMKPINYVRFNGVDLIEKQNDNYDGRSLHVYYLVNPSIGTHTLEISTSGSDNTDITAGAINYSNVDEIYPWPADLLIEKGQQDGTFLVGGNVSCNTSTYLIDFLAIDDDNAVAGSGQEIIFSEANPNGGEFVKSSLIAPGATNIEWTLINSEYVYMYGCLNKCPDPEDCSNNLDDDGDLAVDEDDPDCYSCSGGLLTNPDFQSDLTGWTDWGYTSITTESNGNKYASITGGAGGFGQDEAAVEGDEITMTFQAKKLNTALASAGFAIYDASWVKITSDQAVTITSDNFQKYTVSYTMPANTAWVQPFAWNSDGAGELHIDGFCLTKISNTPLDCNILPNHEFNDGLNNWVLENNSPATSTIIIDNTGQLSGTNSAFIDITNTDGTEWHTQLRNNNISVDAAKTYNISFEAKATASKVIRVSIQQSVSPYTTYYISSNINVTTTAQTFSLPNITVSNSDSDAAFKFYLSTDTDDIWIDNVIFEEVGCTTPTSCASCTGDNLFANPGFESGSYIGADVFITGVYSDDLGSNWGTPSGLDGWSHGPLFWVETTKASEGNKVVYINNDSGGAVCQGQYYDLGDGLDQMSTCNEYALCFDWASFNRGFPSGRSVESRPAMDLTWFDINDNQVGVSHVDLGVATANQDWANLEWTSVSYEFSLTGSLEPPTGAASVRVNISESGSYDNGILFDNTSLCVISACNMFDNEVCYFISDGQTSGTDIQDTLYTFNYVTSAVTPIGPTGTYQIESMAMDTVNKKVYAADSDKFGEIDVATGLFIQISSDVASSINGSEGTLDIDDVDGMTFDHTNNIIWATERRAGGSNGEPDDLLIKIDPLTGLADQNGFGAGIGYLVINTPENDLDDIAIGEDGTLYAISNYGGSGNQAFGTINSTTGAWTEIGDYGIEDVESLAFTATGQLVATTGKDGNDSDQLYTIDAGTGIATYVGSVVPGHDVEACDCISASLINLQIGDIVFADINADGIQDIEEPGVPGVVVNLLTSSGNPYLNDVGAPTTTTTDNDGIYNFDGLPEGDFIVEFVLPGNGESFSPKDSGSDDERDSDANTSTGRSDIITLTGSINDFSIDAGLLNANITLRDCDNVGELFVADGSGNIKRYDPNTGVLIDDFIQGLNGPIEMVVGSDDWLYVSNSLDEEVRKYSLKTGVLVGTIATGFNDPHGMTVGPDGNIYINNDDDDGVVKLDITNETTTTFVTSGAGGLDGNKWGIEFGPDDNLYVTSFYTDEVIRYNGTTGAYMDIFVTGNSSYTNGPSDLTFGPDGHLYVAGKYNDKVSKYNGTTGAYIGEFVSYQSGGLQDPVNLNFGDDGFLYVSSQNNTTGVLKYNGTTGAYIETFASAPAPNGLLFAPVPECGDCPTVDVSGSNIFCPGGITTLSSNVSGGLGTCGYQWESSLDTLTWTPISGATSNLLSISNQTSDTYYRLNYSCSGNTNCLQAFSYAHLVTLNPDILLDITYNGTLCLEDNTQITADVSGGSPGYQYTWTGPNSFSSNLETINVSESGSYFVTITDAVGCTADLSAIVQPEYLPTITIPNSEVCEGESLTLTVNSGSAVQYNWGPNAGNANTSSVMVTPSVASTDYVVTVTNDQGCVGIDTATITMINKPIVNVTGPPSICEGETTTLSPTTGGTWASSNNAVATVSNSGIVTGISAGTVNFTFTNTVTTCESLPTTNITIKAKTPVSVTGPTSICEGFTSQLSPTSGGTWTSNDTNIATVDNNGLVTGISQGSTTFIFTSSGNGCASDATQPISVNDIPVVNVTGVTELCIGSSSTVTPSTGGTWTSSDTNVATITNSGIITAISDGTATFTFTSNAGCVSDPTETVTVDDQGQITISGDPILCEGETTALTASNGGGTWISGDPTVATITSGGVVTAISPGTVIITYDHNSQSCPNDPTFGITINEDPIVNISGSTTICVGENTQLTTTGSGGFWTSDDDNIAIVSSTGIVVGISAGTVTFTYTNGNGCESAASGVITVDPEVNVGVDFNGSLCLEDDSQLSAIVTGGTAGFTYLWTGPNGFTGSSQTISITDDGNYNLTVTDSKGCSSSTTAFVYEAYEPFIFTLNTEICEGEDVTLTVNGDSGTTYQWGANAGNSTASSVVVTPGVPSTTYFVTVTNSIGCSTTASAIIDVLPKTVVEVTGTNNICVGETTQLSPSSGGQWTSSDYSVANVDNTGLVTGLGNGSVTFTFKDDITNCYSDPTEIVTVNDNATVTISGTDQICIADTITLTASAPGGSWSSDNTSIATIDVVTGEITPIAQGTATILYTPPASGCFAPTAYGINIYNTPTLSINGPSTICEGSVTYLSASTSGTWTSSDESVAIVSAIGEVTGVGAGAVYFSFVSSFGCPENLGSPITVIGNPEVSITGPNSVCINETTTLSPTTGGVWISSNNSVATVNSSGVVTGHSAGNAAFTFIESTNGCIAENNLVVTVDPNPSISSPSVSLLCIGETTSITPSTGGTWQSANPSIASITNDGEITAVAQGIVTFTFTSSLTGCTSQASSPVTVQPNPTINFSGPTSVCEGETSTIEPGSGGFWSSTNVSIATITNQGNITAMSPGTVRFIFTSSNSGCVSDSSELFTVIQPAVVSVSGPSNICIGETSSLTPTTGGIWTSNNTSIATVTNDGTVTGISSGSTSFVFIDGSGCSSEATQEIFVDPSPTITYLGSSSICIGENTTLSPSTGGVWASSNTNIATINNYGLVTAISAGSVVLTFTDDNTGCSASAISDLIVYAPPTISIVGADEICIGESTTLQPTSGGSWISSNYSVASISNSGVVTALSAGTATFTFIESSTGCISADSDPITVLPSPIATIDGTNTICVGSTTTLSPSTGGTWQSDNTSVAIVSNAGVVTGVSQGLAKFTFTSSAGCSSSKTSPVIVFESPSVIIDGPSAICIGSTTQMLPSSSGTWTSSNNSVATIDNSGLVTAIAAGTATFTFIDGNTGCVSDPSDVLTVDSDPITSLIGPAEICIGGITNMTPTAGGIWTSINPEIATISNNGEIVGMSTGVAKFVFMNLSTGCSSDTTSGITVIAGPDINFNGPTDICIGDTTYILPSSGGVWESMNPAIASITNSGMIISISSGDVAFKFTDSTTGCISEPSENLTVNTPPSVGIVGPSVICISSETNLSPSSGGVWESLNPGVASVDANGLVTGMSAGTANFKFTDDFTGCVSIDEIAIEVQSAPEIEITGSSTICLGYTTALSPSLVGIWESSNPTIATVSNMGVVTGLAPGVVTFTYTDPISGCTSVGASDPLTIANCTNHDFNVALKDEVVYGNINTNDNISDSVIYGGTVSLVNKPLSSMYTLTVNPDGSYSFEANKGGKYIFEVSACLPPILLGCNATTLEINVIEDVFVNQNPVANLEFTTTYRGALPADSGQTVIIEALANDTCLFGGGCALDETTISLIGTPGNGTASINASYQIEYTPNPDFNGLDTINYSVCMTDGVTCTESQEIIIVNHTSALNSAVANDDFYYSFREFAVSGNIMTNDFDPEGDLISIIAAGTPLSPIVIPEGEYYIESNGNFEFTPNDDFVGTLNIVYSLCDNQPEPYCTNGTIHLMILDDMTLQIRVYLEGSLIDNGGEETLEGLPLMRDDLRVSPFTGKNYIPLSDPYTFDKDPFAITEDMFTKMGPGLMVKNQNITDSLGVFSVDGENAIVDWVHVELRSKNDSLVVLGTRSGLVQRDGDVVDLDGTSGLRFQGVNADSFYVAVKHRTHLGVMSTLVTSEVLIDFTDQQFPVFNFGDALQNGFDYSGLSQKNDVVYGYSALWAGDFDSNGKIKFSNPGDDQNLLFLGVLFSSPDFLINYDNAYGYFTSDFNMNSKSKYTNPNDDLNYLFSQILLYPMNTSYLSNFNSLIEQVPH